MLRASRWLLALAFSFPLACAPQRPIPPKQDAVKVFRKELARRIDDGQKLWSGLHQLSQKQGTDLPELAPHLQRLQGTLSDHYLWLQENAARLNGQYPGALPEPIQEHALRYFSERVASAAIMERFLRHPEEKDKQAFEKATRQADQHFRALEAALNNRSAPAAIKPAAGTVAYQAKRDGQQLKAVLVRIPGISRVALDPKLGVLAYTRHANQDAAKPLVEAATKAVFTAFKGKRRDVRVGFRRWDNQKLFDVYILTEPKKQIVRLKGSHALSVLGAYQTIVQEHAPLKAVAVAPVRRGVGPRHTRVAPYQQRRYVPRRPIRRNR